MRAIHKWYSLCLGLAGTLLLSTEGAAQARVPDPRQNVNAVRGWQQERLAWIRPKLDGMVQRSSESLVDRYGLSESTAPAIHQAILEAAASGLSDREALEDVSSQLRLGNHSEALIRLVFLPATRVALGEFLEQQQVEDYSVFVQSRRRREEKAVVDQLAAWADRHLGLRPDQRVKVGQVLAAGPGKEWLSSQVLVRMRPEGFSRFLLRLRLDPGAMDSVLTELQAKAWRLLNGQQMEEDGPEDRTRRRVEAELAAHTEQLGELAAPAARRLVLASKGVAERYVEDEDWARFRPESSSRAIADHPLYQQTIKDVLSEAAYAQYEQKQAERAAFWREASREVALACLDTRVLLSEPRRRQLAATASRLPVDANLPSVAVFAELAAQLERNDLSQWHNDIIQGILLEADWPQEGEIR